MVRKIAVLLSVIAVCACNKHEEAPPPSPPPVTTTTAATTTTATPPVHEGDDLVGLAQGAMIVKPAQSLEAGHGSFRLIDEDPRTTYTTAQDKPTGDPTQSVIELPERSSIQRVEFDTAEAGLDTHVPKQVLVEMSDLSATDGFKPIANVTLTQKNDQAFPANDNVPGRWVRVSVQSNYGGGITEIGEFRAYGKKLTNTPMPNVTGAYESNVYGTIRLTQSGNTVTGCYEGSKTELVGGIEGRVVKFTIDTASDTGPAILVFSPDTKTFFGGFWKTNGVEEHPPMNVFEGKKITDAPGDCPGVKTPDQEMARILEDEKRLRLYGINFDSDSDHLRDESKPTLDLVVQVLKAHADWKLTIEGHTDSTSTPEHNQQLSTARANAVKAYLVAAGIDAARLTPSGLGSTKPVASNDTALGRAANRRVELVRD